MVKEKINALLKALAFNKASIFGSMLSNQDFKKRYSIVKGDDTYSVGNNIYKRDFCFFFYSKGYLVRTFYCEIAGDGAELNNERVSFYQYPCIDTCRAGCWEWVDVA